MVVLIVIVSKIYIKKGEKKNIYHMCLEPFVFIVVAIVVVEAVVMVEVDDVDDVEHCCHLGSG